MDGEHVSRNFRITTRQHTNGCKSKIYTNGCGVGSNYGMLRGLIQFARRPGMSCYRIAQSLAWRMGAPMSPTSRGGLAASPRSVISVISQLNRPWRRLFIRVLWKCVLWTSDEIWTVGRHARLSPSTSDGRRPACQDTTQAQKLATGHA